MPHKNNKHLHMKEEKPIKLLIDKLLKSLILKLDSAALKQELNYAKTTLISNLNKSVQKNIVKEIIIQ